MTDGSPDVALPHDNGIAALLTRAIADVEAVARAEIELQRARMVAKIDGARVAILMLVWAIATGSIALTAVAVGALMVLAQRVGPLWATCIVVGSLMTVSGVLAWLAMRQFKILFGVIEDNA